MSLNPNLGDRRGFPQIAPAGRAQGGDPGGRRAVRADDRSVAGGLEAKPEGIGAGETGSQQAIKERFATLPDVTARPYYFRTSPPEDA